MKFDQIVKHFGSQVAAATAIGCTQPTLSNWKKRGSIPQLQQLRIEMVTLGKLKAQPLLSLKIRKIISRLLSCAIGFVYCPVSGIFFNSNYHNG